MTIFLIVAAFAVLFAFAGIVFVGAASSLTAAAERAEARSRAND